MRIRSLSAILFALVLGLGWSGAWAGNVKITPLGSHTGEFCRNDRALLFEDSEGLRILYDPGRTVAGGTDPRLGTVHVMILSSVHADHIGDVKSAGTDIVDATSNCGAPKTVSAAPNSNFVEIAVATNATVIVGGEMPDFLSAKITSAGGKLAACPGVVDLVVADPPTSPRVCVLRHGAKRVVHRLAANNPGVQFAVIRADHGNGVPRSLLTDPLKTDLTPDNLSAYVGPENGFVVTFTNGLVVYLSGDTGHTSDMASIVRDFYGAELAVLNMGDIFSMGPEEAAFAARRLIRARSVIPSHVNEAATTTGIVNPGSRTARFIDLLKKEPPVHVPLSGQTMEFDGKGKCVVGC